MLMVQDFDEKPKELTFEEILEVGIEVSSLVNNKQFLGK